MRTGMMMADEMNGPWRFAGKDGGMMVHDSPDPHHWTYNSVLGTDNPAFMKINDKYYNYIEDAAAFKTKDGYYLLTTDNYGTNTGIYGAIILWKSKTGLDFKLSDAKIAMGTQLDYWGSDQDREKLFAKPGHFEHDRSGKMERPAVLLIDGVPAYFCAAGDLNLSGGKVSQNYVFKINWNKGQ